MTDSNNQNITRQKLTLKLPSQGSKQVTPTIKVAENRRVSSSSVQVTIKGRKKEVRNDESQSGLNKSELAARIKAASQSAEDVNEIKAHEILSKITKAAKVAKDAVNEFDLKKEEVAKEEIVQVSEVQKNEEELEIKIETIEEKVLETAIVKEAPKKEEADSAYNTDNFDVRNKIRQSIETTNRQKEEREKLIEQRKKEESEKLEKEKKKKQFSPSPVKFGQKNFTPDEGQKKPKPNFKEDGRVNTRRLTYIIDGANPEEIADSDFSGGFRRKKNKSKQSVEEVKEYKKLSREVSLPELITVSELADRMSEKAGDVVKKLFSMGMIVTSNQAIDADTAEIIISEFGHKAKRVSHSDVENVLDDNDEGNFEKMPRAPIVTIMGHVDHGKTSLLVAADDGVKEQTIEAINHAKAANVPIIVAVNKIDKPGCDPRRVKNELLSHDVISEDLGGEVIFVEVSAKNKINLDKLEEAILLQAEVLELKSVYEGKSSGVVLESRVDPNRGVVATLLVQKGTLDVSDLIVVGTSYGKIRKMSDDSGKSVSSAVPSVPVEILGLDNAPSAGDKFVEVSEERQAREIIAYRARKEKEEKSLKNSAKSISDIFKESGKGKLKYLNVIIKADVHGSAEAINGALAKLVNEEVAIKVIHTATGGVSESDINLAAVSDAVIIGFNVRANNSAKEMARLKNVNIRYYSIIYNLVDELKLMLSGMLNPTQNEQYLGQAEIRQIFKVSGVGKIAGSFVIDGMIKRNAKVRLLRDNVVIHDGILKTLKRFKDDAKEVKSGFECGVSFENYEDIKEKDIVECYEIVEQKRNF